MAELRALETRPAQIRLDVITELEQTLAEARLGEIQSVAIAMILADGTTARTRHSMSDNGPAMLGAITVLQRHVLQDME